eukprot:CAMPEP_0180321072 /NCGR_PEP_ID=MMETSP0988-20121125/35935_1 /TAXON_ID=697907 /ORGANISM="non described non described, Strain CCMP2293" /LENGTH=44 /DNA_ID= /DNA_START= /DNA_END= /DNA_ORIENTATION=
MAGSYEHTDKARELVQMLPSHVLSRNELELLRSHFVEGNADDFD